MRNSTRVAAFIALAVFAILISSRAHAAPAVKDTLEVALSQFQAGDYSEALATLKKSAHKKNTDILYWEGVCESKLQKFDAAAPRLEKVMHEEDGAKFSDAAYLAGQAYYAVQDFKKALPAFTLSARRGYKQAASLFYVGYIQSALKNDKAAVESFKKVLASSDDTMKQQAAFQIGEVYFEKGKHMDGKPGQRAYFLNTVRPAYQAAIALDADSATGVNAASRVRDIEARFGTEVETVAAAPAQKSGEHVPFVNPNPAKTVNGNPIPAKPYFFSATQDFKYDTNVINQADQTLTFVSYAGSPYEKTTALGKYTFVFDNRLVVRPELEADATLYMRDTAAVYGSSNTNVNPAVRSNLDYYLFGVAASTLLEYEELWGSRDYTEQHTPLTWYQSSQNIILGERVNYFHFGSTAVKGHYKFYQNAQSDLSARLVGFVISQDVKTINDQMALLSGGYEFQKNHNEFWDQGNLSAGVTYVMPHLYWGILASVSVNLLVVDTMNQFVPRGHEWNTSPSLSLTKYFGKNDMYNVNFNYAYTKNTSGLPAIYAYTKNVFGLAFNVTLGSP